jgi:hypothetical protein
MVAMQGDQVLAVGNLLSVIEERATAAAKTRSRMSTAHAQAAAEAARLRVRALRFLPSKQRSSKSQAVDEGATVAYMNDLARHLTSNITVGIMRSNARSISSAYKLPGERADMCAKAKKMGGLRKKASWRARHGVPLPLAFTVHFRHVETTHASHSHCPSMRATISSQALAIMAVALLERRSSSN